MLHKLVVRPHVNNADAVTSTRRVLVATCLAPMVIATPVFLLGVFAWSQFTTGPFAESEQLKSIAPSEFALSFVAPVYLFLSIFLLVASSALRAFKKLTRQSMLVASACIALALGLWLGPGWGLPFKPLESAVGVITQSLIAFLLLGAVSLAWCRLALGNVREQRGPG